MSNKKLIAVLILSLIIINLLALTLVKAQEAPPGLPSGMENPEEYIEQARNKTLTKWEYLGKEWKSIILKNKLVSAIDSFLQKISFLFVVLFAKPYSLSLTLLIIIILWFYFFFMLGITFKDYSSFSPPIAFSISSVLVIIMAHLRLFEKQANFIIWLIFGEKPWWLKLIWSIIIVAAMVLAIVLITKYGKVIAENRKKMKELEERLKLATGAKTGEALTKAVSKVAK